MYLRAHVHVAIIATSYDIQDIKVLKSLLTIAWPHPTIILEARREIKTQTTMIINQTLNRFSAIADTLLAIRNLAFNQSSRRVTKIRVYCSRNEMYFAII